MKWMCVIDGVTAMFMWFRYFQSVVEVQSTIGRKVGTWRPFAAGYYTGFENRWDGVQENRGRKKSAREATIFLHHGTGACKSFHHPPRGVTFLNLHRGHGRRQK